MPPTRRQLQALGSLQLVGHANNPTKVITELAFITDAHVNAPTKSGQWEADAPLEVQFDDFMNGVNSRGKGTKTRQRKMSAEQAAAILLVTVQKGHVELIAKANDPHTIDVIKILPEARKLLATFLPKLRGYGDNIPYDCQYRGAIALAKRHFFPNGKAPTKKELMALLLQSYQEKREMSLRYPMRPRSTQALAVQTSMRSISGSLRNAMTSGEGLPDDESTAFSNTVVIPSQSDPENKVDLPSDDIVVEPTRMSSDDDMCEMDSEQHEITRPVQLVVATPVVPRSLNPYMTPVSNPRHADRAALPLLGASPTPRSSSNVEIFSDEDGLLGEGAAELLQVTATAQGTLDYYYHAFVSACGKITFLEGEKEEIQKKYDAAKKQVDETEQCLRAANAEKSMLRRWVDRLLVQVKMFCGQLQEMTEEEGIRSVDDVCMELSVPGSS